MENRPIFQFDNRWFTRRNGCWFDPAQIGAPLVLSRQIDVLARADSELWERCQQQDFEDNPKKRGVRIASLNAAKFRDLFTDLQQPKAPPKASPVGMFVPRTRRQKDSGLVRATWRADVLEVRFDIEAGWRQTKQWCFRDSDHAELPANHKLRVTVEVIEDRWTGFRHQSTNSGHGRVAPIDSPSLEATFPVFSQAENRTGPSNIRLLLKHSLGQFVIKLFDEGKMNAALPWHHDGRHCGFYWECVEREEWVTMDGQSVSTARPFVFRLAAVLHPPPRAPLSPEYERSRHASAGYPTLGKRR